MLPDVRLRIGGLRENIVPIPQTLLGGVTGVVSRVVVIVRAFQRLEIVETQPPFRGNIVGPATPIDMPLANIGGVIAALFERIAQANGVAANGHIVDNNAMCERILSGQKAATPGATNRPASDSVGKVGTFSCELINIGGPDLMVARIAKSLHTPLVRQQEDNIRFFHEGLLLNSVDHQRLL